MPSKLDMLFRQAADLHQSGRLSDAIRIYRRVLQTVPDHFGARHFMGVALLQTKAYREALAELQKAVAIDPSHPVAQNNLGVALRASGEELVALRAYDRATKLDPAYEDARINRQAAIDRAFRAAESALLHGELWQAEAIADTLTAVDAEPAFVSLLRAMVLQQRRDFPAALMMADQAIASRAAYGRAFQVRGQIKACLGNHQGAIDDLKAALERGVRTASLYCDFADSFFALSFIKTSLEYYNKAIECSGNIAGLYVNRANALIKLEDLNGAKESLIMAVTIDPKSYEAQYNLGNVLYRLDDVDEAAIRYTNAIKIKNDFAAAYSNRAISRFSQGCFLEALSDHDKSLEFDGTKTVDSFSIPSVIYQRSVLFLTCGRWEEGWRDYQMRFQPSGPLQRRPYKLLDGDSHSKFLLTWTEQGVGDEILQLSMIPDLLSGGLEITVEMDPRLTGVASRSFPTVKCLPRMDPSHVGTEREWQISKPLLEFAPNLRSIPESPPQREHFLKSDKKIREELRKKYLKDQDKFLVGISWGSLVSRDRSNKSCPLDEWGPILSLDKFIFVSLQYGDAKDEIEAANDRFKTKIIVDDSIDPKVNMDSFFGQVDAMDAVVTISNTTAHVGGALGIPTYVMLPIGRGLLWFWGLDGNKTRWYKNVELLRQKSRGDWSNVIEEIANILKAGSFREGR
jgi:tetratricopeptide (TPR) repeat protein